MKVLYRLSCQTNSFIFFGKETLDEKNLFEFMELNDQEQKIRKFVGTIRFVMGQQGSEKFIEDSASKALFDVMERIGFKEASRRAYSVLEKKGDYKVLCEIMETGQENELGMVAQKTVKYLAQEIRELLKKLKI